MNYLVTADITNEAGTIAIPQGTVVSANPIAEIEANGNYGITIQGIEVWVNGERIAIEKSVLVAQSPGSAPTGSGTVPGAPITPNNTAITNSEYCEMADKLGYMVAHRRAWRIGAMIVAGLAVYGLYRLFFSRKSSVA